MEADNESEASLVGTVLEGAYRIERLIAKNDVGAVYEAFHLRLDKPVAIKVMAAELATSPEALERFRREALVTGGLGHPHIVQVFDHSITPTGEPFLAMELLDGEGLDRRLERVGRLPPAVVVHIVKQVASALSAAHAKDIVHRNLKPANICLLELAGETDFVKVLDFGVSKVRSAQVRLTKASMLLGTPNYMSPEQAMGQSDEVDARSDQWALACVAWQCLSGELPFQADDVPTLLDRIVQAPLPVLAAIVPDLPSEMESVLHRALSKTKDQRFPDLTVFSLALENALSTPPAPSVSATLPPPPLPASSPWQSAPAALPAATIPERRPAPPTALLSESPVPAMTPPPVAARRPPPPTAMLPESPVPAMAPPPERKHSPQAASLPAAARAIGSTRKSPARRQDESRRHVVPKPKWPWVLAACAAILIVAIAAILLRPRPAETPAAASPTAPTAQEPEKPPFTPPSSAGVPTPSAEAEVPSVPDLAEAAAAEPSPEKTAKKSGQQKAKHRGHQKSRGKASAPKTQRPRLIENLN